MLPTRPAIRKDRAKAPGNLSLTRNHSYSARQTCTLAPPEATRAQPAVKNATSGRRPRLGLRHMRTIRTLLFCVLAATPVTATAAEEPLALVDALHRAIAGNVDLRRDRITIQ